MPRELPPETDVLMDLPTEPTHSCCGCSCHVCENGHDLSDGPKGHTDECKDRFYASQRRHTDPTDSQPRQ